MNLCQKVPSALASLLCLTLAGCSSEEEQPDAMGGMGGMGGNGSGCMPAIDLLEGYTLTVTAEAEYYVEAPFGYYDTPTMISIEMAPLTEGGSCFLDVEAQPSLLPSSRIITTENQEDFENQSYRIESGSLRTLKMISKSSACEFRKLVVAPECPTE